MAWHHPDEATLTMPINSLAMEILRDYKQSGGWNRDNWMKESAQWGSAGSRDVQRALSEGWAWLISRGLVAWDPSQSSSDAYFVTRLGDEALAQGVTHMDAAARLGMQLHSSIAEVVERQFLLGEYELAVFAAMKAVEVRVRQMAGLPDGLLGTKLMQTAFGPSEPGPLVDNRSRGRRASGDDGTLQGRDGRLQEPQLASIGQLFRRHRGSRNGPAGRPPDAIAR